MNQNMVVLPNVIIQYLAMLPVESEDNILIRPMRAGCFGIGKSVGCLITTAEVSWNNRGGYYGISDEGTSFLARGLRKMRRLLLDDNKDYCIGTGVGYTYDKICAAYGLEQVNAAIRQQILDNRLKRSYAKNNVNGGEKENLSLNEEALQTTEG